MPRRIDRRSFLVGSAAWLGVGGLGLAGCERHDPDRYTDADRALLARQRLEERAASGRGPFGRHVYAGYRGLAELPWFEFDEGGRLVLVDESVPRAIDLHTHLGFSLLFEPHLDLTASSDRVHHHLDCDASAPGCPLDLDVYVNSNFSEEALDDLSYTSFTQGLWGNAVVRTHTIPNLLAEMDRARVERAVLLPIVFDLPFGDHVERTWLEGVEATGAGDRLSVGTSAHLEHEDRIERLEQAAARGARVVKMHPTVQAFYPDDPRAMEIYAAAERLGLVIFFHGGRAGVEPEGRQRYAMPRHYEAALADFPGLPFVIGHAGARDGAAMQELALRYENTWLGIHGQSLTHLDEMIRRTGGERLLFGTDWPWYHLAASLAKVLIVTEDPGRHAIRDAILRDNADRLLARPPASHA
jgi:predicted TIM-barrel fold metal-dependent hydrolase